MEKWPDKNNREKYEINGFIKDYKKFSHGRNFIIEGRSEYVADLLRKNKSKDNKAIQRTLPPQNSVGKAADFLVILK